MGIHFESLSMSLDVNVSEYECKYDDSIPTGTEMEHGFLGPTRVSEL
jgi:hypothetical protein